MLRTRFLYSLCDPLFGITEGVFLSSDSVAFRCHILAVGRLVKQCSRHGVPVGPVLEAHVHGPNAIDYGFDAGLGYPLQGDLIFLIRPQPQARSQGMGVFADYAGVLPVDPHHDLVIQAAVHDFEFHFGHHASGVLTGFRKIALARIHPEWKVSCPEAVTIASITAIIWSRRIWVMPVFRDAAYLRVPKGGLFVIAQRAAVRIHHRLTHEYFERIVERSGCDLDSRPGSICLRRYALDSLGRDIERQAKAKDERQNLLHFILQKNSKVGFVFNA